MYDDISPTQPSARLGVVDFSTVFKHPAQADAASAVVLSVIKTGVPDKCPPGTTRG